MRPGTLYGECDLMAAPVAISSATPRVDVGQWTLKNPDGSTRNFSFDILKRRYGEREHSALTYVRAKLRCWDRDIDHVIRHRDLAAEQVILPPRASDLFTSAHALWSHVDRETDWEGEPHLMAGLTLWFEDVDSEHWAVRQSAAFAQVELADRYGVAVHLIAHEPGLIGRGADFHVHLLCTARTVRNARLGEFAHELLHDGCQLRCHEAWIKWWAAHPRL